MQAIGKLQAQVTAATDKLALLPKRVDRYTATTDVNGDYVLTYPTGRYTNAPVVHVDFVFNNDSHACAYNVKASSNTAVSLRAFRTNSVPVLLGGNVNVITPLASTPIVITVTEF